MAGFIEVLRSGAWLTPARVKVVATILLAFSLIAVAFVAVTSDGRNDRLGRPLGTDFASFYAAGTLVRDGMAAEPYDRAAEFARERDLFGATTQAYVFPYPPPFLLVAALFATLNYPLALLLWVGAGFAFYLAATTTILRGVLAQANASRLGLLLAAAFPAVLVNIGHGQNGFLTAGLFASALLTLERKPVVAGVLFGLLAYKPQFGLMIPLALAAAGQWRAVASAAATVAVLVAATFAAFGTDAWHAFFAATTFTRTVMLEQGGIDWFKFQSVFSWMRLWGAPITFAYAMQALMFISVAAGIVGLWRSRAHYALKAASLALATLLATPFCFDYDLMLLAPAIAFLAYDGFERGFAPWMKTILATLWIVPLFARSIPETTLIPLAVPVMILSFAFLLRRAINEPVFPRLWQFVPRALR